MDRFFFETNNNESILIEVQQNSNILFVDRLVYYTSRIVNNQVKKSESYDLPHIYVLSILCEDQFPLEPDTYFHHCQVVRNNKEPFKKIDVFLVEVEKFFSIDDRVDGSHREQSSRADMLRMFRDILDDKELDVSMATKLLDESFANDVSFASYTNELLLLEDRI